MLDYLWPARSSANAPTILPEDFSALQTPSASSKSVGKKRASTDESNMPPPLLMLPDASDAGVLEGDNDEDDDDDDEGDATVPSFPAPNSIQRLQSGSLNPPPSTSTKPPKPRRKVALQPGFSQLDWARLKASGTNLRGIDTPSLMRVTPSELARHRKRDDAWSVFNGKVYNITPYLRYHPGGVGELMRAAGRDGTELFMKTHAWISIEGMLGNECCIGMLVRE